MNVYNLYWCPLEPTRIDWRAILIGYMRGVLHEEGVAYQGDAISLSEAEMTALQQIFDEITKGIEHDN